MLHINSSAQPVHEAATSLSNMLEKYKNTQVLLLLAGGSALQVLDHVDTTHINEFTTIMMMDERFSNDPSENNFLQMTRTMFFTKLSNSQCTFIPTVPNEAEKHDAFTKRIHDDLTTYLEAKEQLTTIALFGIGSDGHTAAIFPMEKEIFTDTYGLGDVYVQVQYDKNPFAQRCSITPKFITQYIDHTLIYATGEEKREVLQTLSTPYELHELPAYIHSQNDATLFTNLVL